MRTTSIIAAAIIAAIATAASAHTVDGVAYGDMRACLAGDVHKLKDGTDFRRKPESGTNDADKAGWVVQDNGLPGMAARVEAAVKACETTVKAAYAAAAKK